MNDTGTASFAERIDTIEGAYEYMLAYAAQGHDDDGGSGDSVREFLTGAVEAMDGFGAAAGEMAAGAGAELEWADYLAMLDQDIQRASTAMKLVLAQNSISSELIDNLNASIQVRTLLADLFLVDEALKNAGAGKSNSE